MNWTTERPTVPGWYWFRGTVSEGDLPTEPMCILEVSVISGRVTAWPVRNWCDDWTSEDIDSFSGEWCGPIEAPTDASHPMLIEAERKKRILEKHGYTAADARADDLPEHVREELGLDESEE